MDAACRHMTRLCRVGTDRLGLAGCAGGIRVIQILRAPRLCETDRQPAPRFRPPTHPSQAATPQPSTRGDNKGKRKCSGDVVVKCAAWAGEKQQGKEVHTARQLRLTYLLHLVERRLVHAKLLEVILRRLDDLVDDLLVDVTLQLLSARMLLRKCMPWHGVAWHGMCSHAMRRAEATDHNLVRHGDRLPFGAGASACKLSKGRHRRRAGQGVRQLVALYWPLAAGGRR